MTKPHSLLRRLDEAKTLGLPLCGDAAQTIRNLTQELRHLYERTARSSGLKADAMRALDIDVEMYSIDPKTLPPHMRDIMLAHIHHGSEITVTLKTTNPLGVEYLINLIDGIRAPSR